tara:strand:- start:1433 stop:2398 length:966 start_codon:yes stop_codon:yes gene_type:complete
MRVSIAMTTFNGEKFLGNQLDSILNQSTKPDELIICDDSSSDKTLQILEDFKNKAEFLVKIYRNEKNLGFRKNFEKAIGLCKEDLIFIADQDDFWFPNKIELMKKFISFKKECFVAINNTELTDEKLIPSGITKLNQVKKFSGNSEGFISGCCTVLKKEFLSLILPLSKNMEYDSWIHFVAINTNSRLVNNEILQYYRRHESNTTMHLVSKLENINRKERYIKAFKRFFFTSQDKNRKIFNKMNYEESKILKKRLINFTPSSLENSSEISLKMEKFLDKKITAYFLIEKLYKFRLLKKTLLSFFFLFKGKIRFKDLLFIIF